MNIVQCIKIALINWYGWYEFSGPLCFLLVYLVSIIFEKREMIIDLDKSCKKTPLPPNQRPMTVPEDRILDAEVTHTIVGGRVVYRREV